MSSYTLHIRDPLEDADLGAIEVDVTIGHDRRWCFFMTPAALASCGDWVEGTKTRVHLGVPHMIVVSQVDEQIIRSVLASLDAKGELLAHTAPVETASEEEHFLLAVQALRQSRITDPASWQSDTIEDYLEAALAWAHDSRFGERQNIAASPWARFVLSSRPAESMSNRAQLRAVRGR